jgi:hypothetical protein
MSLKVYQCSIYVNTWHKQILCTAIARDLSWQHREAWLIATNRVLLWLPAPSSGCLESRRNVAMCLVWGRKLNEGSRGRHIHIAVESFGTWTNKQVNKQQSTWQILALLRTSLQCQQFPRTWWNTGDVAPRILPRLLYHSQFFLDRAP